MTPQTNPLVRRYLGQLDSELKRVAMREEERLEILGEIESHLAEATGSGVALADAIEKLGPAADLADTYAVELMLNPRPVITDSRLARASRFVMRAGVAGAAALLTVVMGTLGAALALAGATAILFGAIAPFVPRDWIDPTLRAGMPQAVVIGAGIVLLVLGILSVRLVLINIRVMARTLGRAMTGGRR